MIFNKQIIYSRQNKFYITLYSIYNCRGFELSFELIFKSTAHHKSSALVCYLSFLFRNPRFFVTQRSWSHHWCSLHCMVLVSPNGKSDIHLDPVAKDHAKTLRSTEGNEKTMTWTDRLVVNSKVIKWVLFLFFCILWRSFE